MTWRTFFLFLHIMAAIAAFGPSFALAIIGAAGGKEMVHGNFAIRLVHMIESRLIIPGALATGALGVVLIFVGDWNLFDNPWLIIAILAYLSAISFAIFVQNRWVARMVHISGGEEGGPPDATAMAELPGLVKKTRMGGAFMSLMLLTIVLMMVWKPGAGGS